MLNEMRLGRISDDTVKTFKSLSRPLQFEDGLEVTELSVIPVHVILCRANIVPGSPREVKLRTPTRKDCESFLVRFIDMMRSTLETLTFEKNCSRT